MAQTQVWKSPSSAYIGILYLIAASRPGSAAPDDPVDLPNHRLTAGVGKRPEVLLEHGFAHHRSSKSTTSGAWSEGIPG
jgi:hypothetical protein